MMMIGDGMPTIQSKEVIGLVIKMLSTICARKHPMPSLNSNLMECPFPEPKKAKSIKEPLEDNPKNVEKNKLTEPAQSLIELDMQCCILCLEDP